MEIGWMWKAKRPNTLGQKRSNEKLTIKNVGGILKKYANPALIELEKNAWSIHVLDKFASS